MLLDILAWFILKRLIEGTNGFEFVTFHMPRHKQELPVHTIWRPATCQMPSGISYWVYVLEGIVTHIAEVICACAMELEDMDGRKVSCPSSMWA